MNVKVNGAIEQSNQKHNLYNKGQIPPSHTFSCRDTKKFNKTWILFILRQLIKRIMLQSIKRGDLALRIRSTYKILDGLSRGNFYEINMKTSAPIALKVFKLIIPSSSPRHNI